MGPLALWTLWLAGLWLVVSWLNRRPELFAAFQAALSFAVLFAVAAWLETHAPDVPLPRALQLYGIGLAVLSLFWVAVRIRLHSVATTGTLLSPSRPAVRRAGLPGLRVEELRHAQFRFPPGPVVEVVLTDLFPPARA